MIKIFNHDKLIERWNAGYSCREIITELDLDISERQIQRIGAKEGSWKKRWLGRMERKEAVDNKTIVG